MKLHSSIQINGRDYASGDDVAGIFVYPFFLIHMLAFGGSAFLMAYLGGVPVGVLYLQGSIAILVYLLFYFIIFGRDEVKWMFINAGLGILGIYSQINWLLSLFGRRAADYPLYVHVIPGLYFVLYTFLLRHAVLDFLGAREDDTKRRRVEWGYIGTSLVVYLLAHFLEG